MSGMQRKRSVAAYPGFESVTPDRSLPPLFHCGHSSGAFDRERSFKGGNQLFCLVVACAAYSASASGAKPSSKPAMSGRREVINQYQLQWSAITGKGGQLARSMQLCQSAKVSNGLDVAPAATLSTWVAFSHRVAQHLLHGADVGGRHAAASRHFGNRLRPAGERRPRSSRTGAKRRVVTDSCPQRYLNLTLTIQPPSWRFSSTRFTCRKGRSHGFFGRSLAADKRFVRVLITDDKDDASRRHRQIL